MVSSNTAQILQREDDSVIFQSILVLIVPAALFSLNSKLSSAHAIITYEAITKLAAITAAIPHQPSMSLFFSNTM